MDEVFIDIRKENKWIQKYFTTDFVTIDNLLGVIQDLDSEVDYWKNMYYEELDGHIMQEEDAYDRWKDHQLEMEDRKNE